jgi:glycosyltransferase involved in cell wall biosynthesis
MKKVSILIPVYNEQESLLLLYNELKKLMNNLNYYTWEVLFINDGSNDETLSVIRDLRKEDNRISYLDLSRNYGKEVAMLAGFDYVTGDCMIIMDADLQDPPAIVPQMLEKWEEGYEDIYAEKDYRGKESWLRKTFSLIFYYLLQKTTKINILQNVGDFRLLDRRCIEALKRMREQERYTKGMFCWIGYKKFSIKFNRGDRVAGNTHWSYLQLARLAMEGVISFTTAPLKIATFLGISVSFIAFIYMLYVLIKTLIWGDPVAGYPTLMIVILFLGGSILLTLGIIGEYLSRIFLETKNRPTYIAREYNDKLI